eukprot:TRINITY_DN8644_c0_g1_i1.p1 TRINITY_DN8644_c0_g1~~TRINITY_DN8644_c0_g1_i1.p1  ORF type:complete len:213 (-),score=20.16 TRINITY_DN8644_c0_g1_i1:117-755(-)
MKSQFFIFLLFLFLTIGSILALPGGPKQTNIDNADVIEAASFAARQLSTALKLTFSVDHISKANVQVVAGKNYYIWLTLTDENSKKYDYYVIVFVNINGEYSLARYKEFKGFKKCPKCLSQVLAKSSKCYNGLINGCGCCINTGERIKKQRETRSTPTTKQAQLCTNGFPQTRKNRNCQKFKSLEECNKHVEKCKNKQNQVKPWLCGTCSEL